MAIYMTAPEVEVYFIGMTCDELIDGCAVRLVNESSITAYVEYWDVALWLSMTVGFLVEAGLLLGIVHFEWSVYGTYMPSLQ